VRFSRIVGRTTSFHAIPPVTAAYICRFLPGGKEGFVEIVRRIPPETDPRIERFLSAWDSTQPHDRREFLTLECICEAAEIRFADLLSMVVKEAYQQNIDLARLLASVATPKVIERLAERAASKSKGSHEDRKTFLLGQGFLPSPRGTNIQIANIASSQAAAEQDAKFNIPDFAEDAQQAVEAVRVEEEKKK
jgi:hypothetical protein